MKRGLGRDDQVRAVCSDVSVSNNSKPSLPGFHLSPLMFLSETTEKSSLPGFHWRAAESRS